MTEKQARQIAAKITQGSLKGAGFDGALVAPRPDSEWVVVAYSNRIHNPDWSLETLAQYEHALTLTY
jgi:hypothetical protein